jgi:hypothetical protein
MNDECMGIYFGAGMECYTLDLLVECETGIVGDSYTRNRTKPNVTTPSKAPPVASSEPEIHLQARRSERGAAEEVVAVHFVDWRRASNWSTWPTGVFDKDLTFPPFQLNISNALFTARALPGW